MSLLLKGTCASPGIVIATVHIVNRKTVEVSRRDISEPDIDAEIERFNTALRKTREHLVDIRSSLEISTSPGVASFVDAHLLMLDDIPMRVAPVEFIRKEQCNAEWAVKHEHDKLLDLFQLMTDGYLKTRGDDITQLSKLILGHLTGEDLAIKKSEKQILEGKIIVADDLTPADTVVLSNCKVQGFITELGGVTSHTAILARSINIPAVVATHGARQLLQENETVILDGKNGIVIADVTPEIFAEYQEKITAEKGRKRSLRQLRNRKAVSRDGIEIRVMANVELNAEIDALGSSGADGVGLYRTEFLYADRDEPANEDEQYEVYKKIVKTMAGKPVTIRTLDIGGDKEFDPDYQGALATNPALGLRGIRRSLKEPEVFLDQLKAIMRVSALGPVKILIPMLTNSQEITQINQLLHRARQELEADRIECAADIPLGAMIEVPAVALYANYLATMLDFLSIGTNDLIQYTLAIDRNDDEVSYLYDPMHPGVLMLIKDVLEAGRKNQTPVAMCGEMAGDPLFTRLLLGMGLREFSAPPSNLLEVKEIILNCHVGELRKKCSTILRPARSAEFSQRIAEL